MQELVARDPGVVHQDVEAPVRAIIFVHGRLGRSSAFVTSIVQASARPPAAAISCAACTAASPQHVGQRHQRARPGERHGDRAADAARRARHDRHLPGQIEHRAPLHGPRRRAKRHIIHARDVVRTEAEREPVALSRPDGSSTFASAASRSIFRTRPQSTVPGPTSTYLRTPSDASRRITSSQRTGDDTCRTSASIAAAASRFGSASTLATTGTRGFARRERAQFGREPLLGRLHQRAVERGAHRQRHHPLRARAPSPAPPARATAAARAGNHHLARACSCSRG